MPILIIIFHDVRMKLAAILVLVITLCLISVDMVDAGRRAKCHSNGNCAIWM